MHVWQSPPGTPATDTDEDSVQLRVRSGAGAAGATAATTDGVTRSGAGEAGATSAATDVVTHCGAGAAGATSADTDGVTVNGTDGSAGVPSVAESSAGSAGSSTYEENPSPRGVCLPPPVVGSGRQSSRIPPAGSPDDGDVERQSRSCCLKYSDVLKIFIPWRRPARDPSYLPAHSVGFLSYLSLSWMSRLMYKTRTGINLEDMWKLPEVDGAEKGCDRLQRLWFAEVCAAKAAGRPPSVARAVARAVATCTAVVVLISLLYTALVFFLTSHMVRMTLDYVNSPGSDASQGWTIVALVVGLNLLRSLVINAMTTVSIFSAVRVLGGLQAMLFRKVLRLRTAGEDISGQVANIINNDMERIIEVMVSLIFAPGLPLMAVATLVYCWHIVGPWSLIGYLPIFLFVPVMKHIAQRIGVLRAEVCKVSDQRVSLMTEILTNVRLIKMYSWEESFADSVEKMRAQEVIKVRKIGILNSLNMMMFPVMSYVSMFTIMVAITLSGLPFSASTAFTLMSVLNCFQFSLAIVPFALRSIPEAAVAMGRIKDILLREEHVKHECSAVPSAVAVSIQHASFQWGGEEEARPTNDNNNDNSDNDKDCKNKHRNGNKNEKNENDASNKNKYKNGNTNNSINNVTNDTNKYKSESNNYNNGSNTGKDNDGYCFEEDIEDQFINGTRNLNMRNMKHGKSPGASFAPAPVPTLPSDPSQQQQFLRDIDLSVPTGKLLGICGSVGSGKSSLFSAICGDMALVSGEVQVNGRVALVTQQAWIYNTSMRNNLLMGTPYDRERYQTMLKACCLDTDIQAMPNGDSTEIGEKGINLSGGQKQRVSLGRAVYSDRDIYLLDDPLSAVDTRVALHIFRHCITGCLRGKTILLVTHALHFLEQCDEVLLVRSGAIVERGSHAELLERRGAYAHFLSHDKTAQQRHVQVSLASGSSQAARYRRSSSVASVCNRYNDGRLIEEEERETGQVSTSVYHHFMKTSGGWGAVVAVLTSILLFTCARLFAVMWQQWWLDAGDGLMEERVLNQTMHGGDNSTVSPSLSDADLRGDISSHPRLYVFQTVQAALFLAVIVAGVVKGYATVYTLTKGSRRLHNLMYASVMRAPTSFFDVTPTGRILTRFTKDVDEIDYRIPIIFDLLTSVLFLTVAGAVLVCVFFPYFAVVMLPLGVLFVLLGRMLDQGMREFKRLENIQKSPVVQSAVSCIAGLQVIRAYGQEEAFTSSFYQLLDEHTVVLLLFKLSNRWITFRMDILSVAIVGALTTLFVLTKGAFSTAMAGLALTSANEMYLMLPLLMVIKTEFEARMTSVERVLEYAQNVAPEAAREVPGAVGADWPQRGALVLRDVCLRYRPNLPLVLKGITADIAPGEKIGVVGRTGAGKSSLVNALLRVVELERGSIQVDGVDVKGVGLHTLRSAVSVIPQDPVLFQGTIRYNLDPFGDHTDEAVLQAAARSRLLTLVERHPEGLGALVETSGQNFSVGERQLICLTRAVLRNSKILLLDEATASVDPETDQLIQTALHETFHSATLLTVAHRLHTVAHYDRIMVLEKGQLVEFDTPHALLEREGSVFGKMLAAIGVTSVDQLDKLS